MIMKIKTFFSILTLIVFMIPTIAMSAETGVDHSSVQSGMNMGTSKTQTTTLQNPLKSNLNSVGAVVNKFLEIFTYIVVIFAVLAIIFVGFRFVLARGNTEELNKLKDWLMWIVIGVAIVIGARIIMQIVINTLSDTGVINQQVIQSAKNAVNTN